MCLQLRNSRPSEANMKRELKSTTGNRYGTEVRRFVGTYPNSLTRELFSCVLVPHCRHYGICRRESPFLVLLPPVFFLVSLLFFLSCCFAYFYPIPLIKRAIFLANPGHYTCFTIPDARCLPDIACILARHSPHPQIQASSRVFGNRPPICLLK